MHDIWRQQVLFVCAIRSQRLEPYPPGDTLQFYTAARQLDFHFPRFLTFNIGVNCVFRAEPRARD